MENPTHPILNSLIQSRKNLLTNILPLFTTSTTNKSKNKSQQQQQFKHNLTNLTPPNESGISIQIGPHSFLNSNLFLCDWLEEEESETLSINQNIPLNLNKNQNNNNNNNNLQFGPLPTTTSSSASSSSFSTFNTTSGPTNASTILNSPLPSPAPTSTTTSGEKGITPNLITLLNQASLKDLNLANILKKAAINEATEVELKELSDYIEVVRGEEIIRVGQDGNRNGSGVGGSVVGVSGSGKANSIVIEFKENLNDRFIIPSHYTYTQLPSSSSLPSSTSSFSSLIPTISSTPIEDPTILLSFFVFPSSSSSSSSTSSSSVSKPFKSIQAQAQSGQTQESKTPTPISLLLHSCSPSIRNHLFQNSITATKQNGKGMGGNLGSIGEEGTEIWFKKMLDRIPSRVLVVDPVVPIPIYVEPSPPTQAMVVGGLGGMGGIGTGIGGSINMSRASSGFSNTSGSLPPLPLPSTSTSTSHLTSNQHPLSKLSTTKKSSNPLERRLSTPTSTSSNVNQTSIDSTGGNISGIGKSKAFNKMILDSNGIPIRMKLKPGPKIGSKSAKGKNKNKGFKLASGVGVASASGSGSGSGGGVKVEGTGGVAGAGGHLGIKKPGPKRIRDRKAETARSQLIQAHADAIANGKPLPSEEIPIKKKRGKGKFNRVKIHPVE